MYSRLMIRCKIFCRRGGRLLAGAEVPGVPTRLAVRGLGPNVEGEAAPCCTVPVGAKITGLIAFCELMLMANKVG